MCHFISVNLKLWKIKTNILLVDECKVENNCFKFFHAQNVFNSSLTEIIVVVIIITPLLKSENGVAHSTYIEYLDQGKMLCPALVLYVKNTY